MKRKSISKKVRFEVFKRDSFTCQYCGQKSPDVVLEIDHIEPVSKGGSNDILNLVSACKACNAGKSDRRLSDNTVIEKQRTQLEELQERRQQLDMLMHWQKELLALEKSILWELVDYWYQLVEPVEYIDHKGLQNLVKRYGVAEVMECMKLAADRYTVAEDGELTVESVWRAWGYVGRICNVRRSSEAKPYLRDVLYIRGILRNRLPDCEERAALILLEQAVEQGADMDSLKEHAKQVGTWAEWKLGMEAVISSPQLKAVNG